MSRYTTEQMEREVTKDMVKSEGEMITLLRPPASAEDGAGGFVDQDADPVPQTPRRRIVTAVSSRLRNGKDLMWEEDWEGQRYKVSYVMVGVFDDDIQKGDTFTYRGQDLTIASVFEDRSYQVRAHVITVGDGAV